MNFQWITPRSAMTFLFVFALVLSFFVAVSSPTMADEHPELLVVPNSAAANEAEMKPYAELIEHTSEKIQMLPIHGGSFLMGSPATEAGREESEGPQHEVKISPFWMGKYEITWDQYDVWMEDLDIARRQVFGRKKNIRDQLADEYQLSQPTEPYCDMSFGMGKRTSPAICMTQLAARTYCNWLSAKTGRYYRLPTEAEWEYACRAGTQTAYSFGDDAAQLGDYAWYYDNSDETYHKVGLKKPNPWGLYDMHGNVAEWVLDQYTSDFYGKASANNLFAIPQTLYPRVVRGGSWDDDAPLLRSAARVGSHEDWKEQDPQIPKSIWYHTDALGVGFRIVRPLATPSAKEKAALWDKSAPVQDRHEPEAE